MNKNFTNIFLLIAVGVFLFGGGYKLGEFNTLNGSQVVSNYTLLNASPNNIKDSKGKNVDFTLFWDAWNELDQKYVDRTKLDPQKMLYGAIKGLAASLDDPYTFFLPPVENKQSKDDLGGRFEGIGAQLGLQNNAIIIIAPLKNSPAEKAGVQSGDYVIKVNGESTKSWTLTQAVSKIRGVKGTKVTLGLLRNGKEIDLSIARDQIKVQSVELSYDPQSNCGSTCNQIAVVKINQFGDNTITEWNQAIDEVSTKWQNKQIKGLVLDLRGNPGGYLETSVYIASEFLDPGKVVVKQESTIAPTKEYTVTREGKLRDIPMVVMIDRGSASASEILSGALRDYKRATLLGEKSFGKGSVQEPIDLRNGAGLHVTVAKWLLPKGEWINGKGIQPEIKVTNDIKEGNTLTHDTDKQLQTGVETLMK